MTSSEKTFRIGVILFALIFFLCPKDATPGEKLKVSTIPHLSLKKDEKVVGFQVTVTGGIISSLPNVPDGWDIYLNNYLSLKPTVKGGVITGTFALDVKEDIEFFKNIVIVEKRESLPFDIEIEIVATTDFQNTRRIILKNRDLTIEKLNPN
jgi:hypothetical protein